MRRTIKQLDSERREAALLDMASEIAGGRMTVRQMTPSERAKAMSRRAAVRERRHARK